MASGAKREEKDKFDHSVRVPLIVAGPGIPKGERRDQQVYLQDIMATSLDLSGTARLANVYFRSLLPMIRNNSTGGPYKEIYGAYMNLQRMVRTDKYKLIVYPSANKIILFDLAKDPDEKQDVSADPAYRSIAAEMKERLLRQQKDLGDTLDLSATLQQIPKAAHSERKIELQRDSLPSGNFIKLYGKPTNFFLHANREKEVSVAFLGGSITAGQGWRDRVMQYLEHAYPQTKWNFLNAGIPSLGSLPHAYRFESDVLAHGDVDLLFIESAVNDLANQTPPLQQMRALEGIVRQARNARPDMDIVLMAFADEPKLSDYASGRVPAEVGVHQKVAKHYKLPFINLSEEVYKRIEAKEFTWKEDFVDLHPSTFGHQLYARTIRTMFELSDPDKVPSRIRSYRMPAPIDRFSYAQGEYVSVDRAEHERGFRVDPSWKPSDQARTRRRFVEMPMLVSDEAGSSFEFSFEGNAVGIALVSGPDAGIIRYSIDGGQEQTKDLFTQWSRSLHLPWYLILGDGLAEGKHTLRVTLLADHHPKATGSACRIVYFLVNGRQ